MIADAENKKFDLLLTKEISRFARNTLDSIFYTRKLKELGVGVFFMNDNINTLDADSELRLTIMSSIAQEESRKTSDRVKWGQKRRMEQGVVFGTSVFGYHLKKGKLTINEDEAKNVRLIFGMYLEGKGTHLIRKELENRGINTPKGYERWRAVTILNILKNEKYAGNLKQKKRITIDYLSHKTKNNEGEEAYITIENNHEPIVTKGMLDRVQEEIRKRKTAALEKSRYSNRYVWSGKIECAHCKSKFERRVNNRKTEHFQVVWRCGEAVQYGREKINSQGQKIGCNNKAVHERILQENFLAILDSVITNKNQVVDELKKVIRQNITDSSNNDTEIEAITADIEKIAVLRKAKLIDAFVDGLISRAEFEQTNSRYNERLDFLNNRLRSLENGSKTADTLQQKLNNIETAIENLVKLKEFGDSICCEILHKVVVDGREKIAYYLSADKNASHFYKMPVSLVQSVPT
jgi:DNA invertase Pin-like site-specific DNA recombinase/exonuclease VII small subunit